MISEPAPPPFPNLFTEACEMTIACIMVFAMADLRRLARSGDLESFHSEQLLNLPLQSEDLIAILQESKDITKGKVRSNEYDTLEYILENFVQEEISWTKKETLYYLGDDNAQKECVYGISVNSERQRVTLCFRGSITINDWLTDAKMICGDLPNPLAPNDEDQPETLQVHLGFRDYLYGDAPSILPEPLQQIQTSSEKTKGKSKIETIMEQVKAVMHENPGYRLYITGHSLGGALCVLASLEAAVRFGEKDHPVTCVTVANPRVGDKGFRAAIQTLEQQGRLRCLLVHNHLDLVPLQPDTVFYCYLCRHLGFVQQGMQLTLYKQDFDTHYYGENETCMERTGRRLKHQIITLMCWIRMAEQHNYREYLNRLIAQKEELSRVSLNDLYEAEGIEYLAAAVQERLESKKQI